MIEDILNKLKNDDSAMIASTGTKITHPATTARRRGDRNSHAAKRRPRLARVDVDIAFLLDRRRLGHDVTAG